MDKQQIEENKEAFLKDTEDIVRRELKFKKEKFLKCSEEIFEEYFAENKIKFTNLLNKMIN